MMKIKLYDRVLLKDGNRASIVEIYEPDKYFIADIDTKDGRVTATSREIGGIFIPKLHRCNTI